MPRHPEGHAQVWESSEKGLIAHLGLTLKLCTSKKTHTWAACGALKSCPTCTQRPWSKAKRTDFLEEFKKSLSYHWVAIKLTVKISMAAHGKEYRLQKNRLQKSLNKKEQNQSLGKGGIWIPELSPYTS